MSSFGEVSCEKYGGCHIDTPPTSLTKITLQILYKHINMHTLHLFVETDKHKNNNSRMTAAYSFLLNLITFAERQFAFQLIDSYNMKKKKKKKEKASVF